MNAIEYGNATAMDMTNNYERAVDPATLMTAIVNIRTKITLLEGFEARTSARDLLAE